MSVEYPDAFFPGIDKALALPIYKTDNEFDVFSTNVALYNQEFNVQPPLDPVQAFIDFAKWKSDLSEHVPIKVYDSKNKTFYIWFELDGESVRSITDLEGLLDVFSSLAAKGLPLPCVVEILQSLQGDGLIELNGEDKDFGRVIVATDKRKRHWAHLLISRGLVSVEDISSAVDKGNENDLPNND